MIQFETTNSGSKWFEFPPKRWVESAVVCKLGIPYLPSFLPLRARISPSCCSHVRIYLRSPTPGHLKSLKSLTNFAPPQNVRLEITLNFQMKSHNFMWLLEAWQDHKAICCFSISHDFNSLSSIKKGSQFDGLGYGSKPYLLVSAVHSVTNWPFQYLPPWRGCHDCQNDELCQASKSTCKSQRGWDLLVFLSLDIEIGMFFSGFFHQLSWHMGHIKILQQLGVKNPPAVTCAILEDWIWMMRPLCLQTRRGGGRLKKRCFFFSTDFMKWLEIFGGVEKEAETQVWKTTICCLGLPTRSWIGDAWCWIDPGYCLGTGTTGFGAERFGLDVSWWDDFLSKVRMGLYIHIGITY